MVLGATPVAAGASEAMFVLMKKGKLVVGEQAELSCSCFPCVKAATPTSSASTWAQHLFISFVCAALAVKRREPARDICIHSELPIQRKRKVPGDRSNPDTKMGHLKGRPDELVLDLMLNVLNGGVWPQFASFTIDSTLPAGCRIVDDRPGK